MSVLCRPFRLNDLLTGGKLGTYKRLVYLLTLWMCVCGLCYGLFHVWTPISKENYDMESSFIQGLAHNVPYDYYEKAEKSKNKNKCKQKCACFPSTFDLRFNNK